MPVQLTDEDNQSESSSYDDDAIAELSSPDGTAIELDSLSEESQASRSSSPSHTTSPSLSSRAHSQAPKGSETVTDTTKQGSENIRRLVSVQSSQLRYPKSQYSNYVPPLPVCHERYAVDDLLRELERHNSAKGKSSRTAPPEQEFMELELSEFVMYLPNNRHHPYELWSLQDLASKSSCSTMLFDGILRVGDVQRYVQAVPFDTCSIGNYGEDIHDVGENIWIRSTHLAKSEIYYRLKSPASEYARFYSGFLWLANLAKHFVDYSQWAVDMKMQVSVFNFRTDFSQWVQRRHVMSSSFQLWYQKHQSDDFRQAVAANIHFLFKESIGVNDKLRRQPIWNELLEKEIVPIQEIKESKTVVTPYVYDCFEHLRFGHLLKSVEPRHSPQVPSIFQSKALARPVNGVARRLSVEVSRSKTSKPLTTLSDIDKDISIHHPYSDHHVERGRKIKTMQVGDVLSVTKDGEGSVWKDEKTRWKTADDCWYIYVQGVHESKNGSRSFAGLWLYKSSDTCCAKMKYPFPNEMFLSDNCTCSHGRIQGDEVLDIVAVEWHGSPSTSPQRLFVRQTYLENDKFETLKEEHKTCEHLRHEEGPVSPKQQFPIGQTVLVPPPGRESKHALEPYEIVHYIEEGTNSLVILKHLLRRNEIPGQKGRRSNELVYSDRTYEVLAAKVKYTCLVRFYSEVDVTEHSIPTPYDRDGVGNAFYITTRLVESEGHQKLVPIHDNLPQTLIQGFDPTDTPPAKLLQGLDLYCGGGNFGRGLEEGGALHNEWAVDYAKTPMHSYYANLKDPTSTKLFCGSVDDQLYQALRGNPQRSNLIPMPGEVDFISAGSPCQGFSALNASKNNDKGLKNQSLVASVAAYIDFYRPKYGLLENVMTMAQKGLGRDEDVLSQLICAIVGMGYQLQLFVLDAWSLGSPQSRSRLFVSFAAPGYPPLEHPQLSHSHPANTTSRGLGKLANGESFGHRIHHPTPFEYVTASEATKDLPSVGDGQTFQCTPYPDHVMTIKPSTDLRFQMAVIPTHPRGSSFVSAWNEGRGVMTEGQRALFPSLTSSGETRQCVRKTSKAWGRVHPHRLFPTIVASVYPMDARMGTCLHWDQQRMITLMEARRAQGFPDHEVLVGSAPDKWKVIGNSVPRTVSLALGLSLRHVWLKCSSRNEPSTVESTVETATRAIIPSTQSYTREKTRAVLQSQLREPIIICSNKTPEESNGGRPLGPVPIRSTAHISLTEAITAPNAREEQKHRLRRTHGIEKGTRTLPSPNPLKRRHSTLLETSTIPLQKKYKTPEESLSASSVPTSSTDSGHERSRAMEGPRDVAGRSLSVSGLRKELDAAVHRQIAQKRKSLQRSRLQSHEPDHDSASDDDEEDNSLLDSIISKQHRKFQSRIATSQSTGSAQVVGKEGSKHRIFINLDSKHRRQWVQCE